MIEVMKAWGSESSMKGTELFPYAYKTRTNACAEHGEPTIPVVILRATDWQRIEALMRMVAGMPDNDDCEWLMEMRHHAREMGFGE